MIPKYKYKHKDRPHGEVIQYCSFDVLAQGRRLTPWGWRRRDIAVWRFETYSFSIRRVEYDKPIRNDLTIMDSDDPQECMIAGVEHVDTLEVYDMPDICEDLELFLDGVNQNDDTHFLKLNEEYHVAKRI